MNEFDNIAFLEMDNDAELIPILSTEDEEKFSSEDLPETLPILPLRNTVLLPGVVIPITVGREKSVKLVTDANEADKIIGVVAQKEGKIEDPSFDQLHQIGTVAHIVKILKMPDGNTTVIIQGKRRFELGSMVQENPYMKANIKPYAGLTEIPEDKKFSALVGSLKDLALQIIKYSPNIPSEAAFAIKNIDNTSFW